VAGYLVKGSVIGAVAAACVAGAVADVLGSESASFSDSVGAAALVGAAVGYVFAQGDRDFNDPLIAIHSFAPAGFLGGLVAAYIAGCPTIGYISAAVVGSVVGTFGPAVLIAYMTARDEKR